LFFTETPSLKTIIMGLWEQGETVLALIIIAFSVLLPAAKILLLHIAVYRGKKSRSLALLSVASKWSMMDVLLVALVIFSAKTSGLATASAMPGIWFYATATLASVLASIMVRK
jgi:paraquat-inducible protein A